MVVVASSSSQSLSSLLHFVRDLLISRGDQHASSAQHTATSQTPMASYWPTFITLSFGRCLALSLVLVVLFTANDSLLLHTFTGLSGRLWPGTMRHVKLSKTDATTTTFL